MLERDARVRYLVNKIAEQLGFDEGGGNLSISPSSVCEKYASDILSFLRPFGKQKLFFFYQPRMIRTDEFISEGSTASSSATATSPVPGSPSRTDRAPMASVRTIRNLSKAGSKALQSQSSGLGSLEGMNSGSTSSLLSSIDPSDLEPVLYVANPETDKLVGTCIYFVRLCPNDHEVSVKDTEMIQELVCGRIDGSPFQSLQLSLSDIYVPLLRTKADWGKNSKENVDEYVVSVNRFVDTLQDAVRVQSERVELVLPSKQYTVANNQQALVKAATDEDLVLHFEEIVDAWCVQAEELLTLDAPGGAPGSAGAGAGGGANQGAGAAGSVDSMSINMNFDSEDVGPNSELEFWKQRMGKLNSIMEQLKNKDCKAVLGVLSVARSRALKKWKNVDNMITDAVNEAKDNVKYLTTLEKFTEPLYKGTPQTIIDMLPGLLNNIKMMHSIARYYNTTERMTTLFIKITNQMITNCKQYLLTVDQQQQQQQQQLQQLQQQQSGQNAGGFRNGSASGGPSSGQNAGAPVFTGIALPPGASSLWTQNTAYLLKKMGSCIRLNDSYQDQYRQTREKLLAQPKSKQFDFNDMQIFGKFNLFCKRLQKLMDIFTTIEQFTTLADSKIDGMDTLTQRFFDIVDDLRKKKYDLLDYTKTQFDRDYVDFVRNIQELETALQVFINSSFENITSTENALSLLKKFQAILQRENLKQDLDSKYMVIFHNYGLDLENVQKMYERFKHNPPMVRNAPPVAGNIMWARQLLRRIEVPMKNFQSNRNIMTTKESKKIIRTYNKVARALVEFETLWHYAWAKSIEAAKAGLQATLIVRHPENGRLYVNFDVQILQLIKETKWLMRMGIEVPESARLVLMQEEKFKMYYNQLHYALKEYERVVGKIVPVTRRILLPHVQELERKIQPGMVILTWTSMNIDGYLHQVHSGIMKLEELVTKVNDILDTRIGRNLKIVSRTVLVDIPEDQSFALDQFVALQEKVVRRQALYLNTKTTEVYRAVCDLIHVVRSHSMETAAGTTAGAPAGVGSGSTSSINRSGSSGALTQSLLTASGSSGALDGSPISVGRSPKAGGELSSSFGASNAGGPSSPSSSQALTLSALSASSSSTSGSGSAAAVIPFVDDESCMAFFEYYHRLMFSAIMQSTIRSLHLIRDRIGLRRPGMAYLYVDRPLFEVDVELTIPNVTMNPSIEDIQEAINKVSIAVLRSAKSIDSWQGVNVLTGGVVVGSHAGGANPMLGSTNNASSPKAGGPSSGSPNASSAHLLGGSGTGANARSRRMLTVETGTVGSNRTGDPNSRTVPNLNAAAMGLSSVTGPESFYERVASNKRIVKVVLLLTGSVYGLRQQVMEHLRIYKKYDYLWRDDKQAAYERFVAGNPNLDAFEAELKRYLQVETEISSITTRLNIGMLSLMTQPMKYSLKAEAAAWKSLYAKNLHQTAKSSLERVLQFMDDAAKRLKREIHDLEDLRFVMITLKELRQKESEIDLDFNPVEEMYSLLVRYDVRVPKEEIDAVGEMRYKWRKLMTLSSKVNESVAQMQGGFKRDLIRAVKAFSVDVIQFRNDFEANGPMVPGLSPLEAMDRLKKYQRLFEERENKFETYSSGEELFGLPQQNYPELVKTRKELQLLEKLYTLYMNVIKTVNGYADLPWMDLNFSKITDEVNTFANQCKKMPKALRTWPAYIELKKTIDDFLELQPLLEQLSHRAMRARHWTQIMSLTQHTFRLEADEFKLQDLLDANLLAHKEDVEEVCVGAVKEAEIEAKIATIADDWSNQVLTFAEYKHRGPLILKGSEIMEILERLEDSQMTLGSIISSRYVAPFREETQSWMLKLSTVYEVIEQWMSVQSMWMYLEAVFASGDIAKQLPQEAKRFSQIDKSWSKIMAKANEQRNVIAFCFGNELLKSLPFLGEQLELCQKSLSGYLEQKRNCFPRFYFVSDPVLLEILSQASDPHAIQPHLASIFDSIESITFEASGGGGGGGKSGGNQPRIVAMSSSEGETVPMVEPVVAMGNVEEWLTDLEHGMQQTLKSVTRGIAADCQMMPLEEMIERYCAQAAILGIQFKWTYDCQDALVRSRTDKKVMNDALKTTTTILNELTRMTTVPDLSKLDRTKIETLITMQVHQKDVWDAIVRAKIKEPSDFEWQKQARFYWNLDMDQCVVSIADIDFEYDYEYLGCKERLVITPLTDRCYISLSQALGMYLGGAPAGPAGTGKTETTKDLARALGKYIVVFNCSDQMDYRAMGKIFKGLAQCGAWGCFDEFNRIELEVLSVVAQQVQCVLSAIREHRKEFVFTDGQMVKLIPKCGFFITMNPGYAGRQELPENLKALFRGVAMMVPDRRIIIKVKLAAAGFLENDGLSLKFHVLYRLCEQQLSKQPHYDFGLRNILSVLRTAGATKRAEPTKSEVYLLMRTLRDMNMSKFVAEDVPLFLSLLNDLFPKLKADKASNPTVENAIRRHTAEMGLVFHEPWFDKVIQLYDTSLVRHGIMVVGPSGAGKTKCYDVLLRALSEVDRPHKVYRMNPKAITASQMFGRLDVISNDWFDGIFAALWRKANKDKHSVWIICDGPVDAVWIENLNTVLDDNKLLTLANGDRIKMAGTVKMCFEPENLDNASPATVSRAGIIYISDSVLGWQPVLEARFRAAIAAATGASLASVSGGSSTQSSSSASGGSGGGSSNSGGGNAGGDGSGGSSSSSSGSVSATDSVHAPSMRPAEAERLRKLFNDTMDVSLEFVQKQCHPVISVCSMNLACTCFDLIVGLMRKMVAAAHHAAQSANANSNAGVAPGPTSALSGSMEIPAPVLDRLFVFSMVWSVGALLEPAEREKFSVFFSDKLAGAGLSNALPPISSSPSSGAGGDSGGAVAGGGSAAPGAGAVVGGGNRSLYDFFVDPLTLRWESWEIRIQPWVYPADDRVDFSTLYVPTLDSTRSEYVVDLIGTQHRSVLLVGGSGTAKTITAEQYLFRQNPDVMLYKKICFSSASTPEIFQRTIESAIEKRMGTTYGPPGGRRIIFFIDDISMPEINEWGDQPTNEIVRELMEEGGVYNLDKPGEWKTIVDTQFVGAMVHPGGGKNDIPNRLKRHFAIMNMVTPDVKSIDQIFGGLLRGRFSTEHGYSDAISSVARRITPGTIEMWKLIARTLLPTPAKFHYIFNLRDLSKLFQGLMMCPAQQIILPLAGSSAGGGGDVPSDALLLLQLWHHEARRVFSDRLNNVADKRWFDEALHDLTRRHFGEVMADRTRTPRYFVDFLRYAEIDDETGEEVGEAPKVYEPTESMNDLRDRLEEYQRVYNEVASRRSGRLELVMFDAAVKNLCRVSRVLRMPRGNLLLVGVGGSGKQSLTRLASFIAGYNTFQITMTKTYGVSNLFEDIKGLYRMAAFERPVTFMFTDNDIKEERFLEYINMFLSSGEIAGLFARDEMDAIIGDIRPIAKKECPDTVGKNDTADNLYRYFIDRVRDRLHVVLCFSPVGEKFRTRAQKFPSLFSGCTINWFFPWPKEALRAVAEKLMNAGPPMLGALDSSAHEGGIGHDDGHDADDHHDGFGGDDHHGGGSSSAAGARSGSSMARGGASPGAINRGGSAMGSTSVVGGGGGGLSGGFEMADIVDMITKDRLVEFMAEVHGSMHKVAEDFFQRYRRHVYTTPRSFLTFVESYKTVYSLKLSEISSLANKINSGLHKLLQAGQDVERMKVELLEKEKSLAEAQRETNLLLKSITESTAQAEKTKAGVTAVRNVLSADAEIVAKGKAEAEADLAAARPALEDAENALKAISAGDIQTMKKLQNPPNLVKRIFDCVLILFNKYVDVVQWVDNGKGLMVLQDTWSEALKLMTNAKFIDGLFNFPRDQINDETVELLQPYYDAPDFNFDTARKSCGNVAGLCTWVRAMGVYHEVAKVVAPKVAMLKESEGKLRIANKKLKEKEDELARVEEELDRINREFDCAMRKKQDLEEDASATRTRMEAANHLIAALTGEKTRWTEQSNEFKDMIIRLTGDVGIICAFISYGGPFNAEFRTMLVKKRFPTVCRDLHLSVSSELSPTRFLLNESIMGEWILEGLPTDDHSMQNGIMVTRSTKWPLLIDPQGQGLQWLKKREAQNQLRVCSMTDRGFRQYLEDCLSFGKPMIIENLEEEVDPVLDPILNRELVRSGKTLQVKVGDKLVDYAESFRLYLITKLPNPHFSPELFAKTTVIDFTVTMSGLEDQLLGRVIQQEKAELEEQREALLQDVNMNQKKIMQLEDDLLARLSESQGNLLDDVELIQVLADTKKTSLEVKEKLAIAKETEKRISQAREEYRPVARRGSVLYFVIVELQGLDPMYQTSLKQFLELFDLSIHRAERAPLAKKRIGYIIETQTYMSFQFVARGLFEKHKLLFLVLMASKILLRGQEITPEAFNVFLKGGAALDMESVSRKKPFAWLPDRSWLNLMMLADSLSTFRNLPDMMMGAEAAWRALYDTEAPEDSAIPDYEGRMTPFERLLLIRSLREDRTMLAASQFIGSALGQKYVDPVPFSLGSVFEDSNERCPIVCLLSQGSDPTAAIESLAKKQKKEVRSISMGQGQEPAAKRMLSAGFTQGSWVLLQNCHLGLKFLGEVEQILTQLSSDEIDSGFRLWITSESSPRFPIGLLQMSIKVTMEPPQGLKAGLKRSFQWVNQDMIEASARSEWWPLLYASCFQHSVVQERRKYGPLGWNIPYEFNQSDLAASVQFLQNHMLALGDDLKRSPSVSWTAIKYMISEVQYGGRITDDFDRRLMTTYAKDWLSPLILKPEFQFFKGYVIPAGEDVDKVRKHIEDLPLNDRPEVFGLHANADISYRTAQAQQTLNGILDIQPKESVGSGSMTREESVNVIAADLLSKLPRDFNKDNVRNRIKALGGPQPLNICLSQEINRLQTLISAVRKDLMELQLAIAGTIIMSSTLQQVLDSLFDARVPPVWTKLSWVSSTLGVWFSDLLARQDQLNTWLEKGRPKSFWLAGFYNAQGFLTAVRQEVTRAHEGWALDDVVLKTDLTKSQPEDLRAPPDEGVYIHGLYLEGASWDSKHQRLIDSPPKVLVSMLPVIYITACTVADKRKMAGNRYQCPCYSNPARTARYYIFDLEIPSDEAVSKWILRGVASLCSKE